MNDRLKKMLKLNTFGNEADDFSIEDLAMMAMPMGSIGKSGNLMSQLFNNSGKFVKTGANQQFVNSFKTQEATKRLQNKKMQDAMDYMTGNPKGSWNNPGPMDSMKNDSERILHILKNMKGAAPVAGLTQTLKDTSNVETRKETTLPEQSNRLKGSGFLGKQGKKLFSNETSEQDSLQTDALERLTGSGLFGKKGKNIPEILKAILTRPRP